MKTITITVNEYTPAYYDLCDYLGNPNTGGIGKATWLNVEPDAELSAILAESNETTLIASVS